MSWPGVRVGVLEGLRQLVDNPHAQPVMKKALPQLASLLADPSLKVRGRTERKGGGATLAKMRCLYWMKHVNAHAYPRYRLSKVYNIPEGDP